MNDETTDGPGDHPSDDVNRGGALPGGSGQVGNRARVRRYRDKHRRIDYVPSPAVLEVIEAWLSRRLDNCTAGVIDRLILAGDRAVSGNDVGSVERSVTRGDGPDRAGEMQA